MRNARDRKAIALQSIRYAVYRGSPYGRVVFLPRYEQTTHDPVFFFRSEKDVHYVWIVHWRAHRHPQSIFNAPLLDVSIVGSFVTSGSTKLQVPFNHPVANLINVWERTRVIDRKHHASGISWKTTILWRPCTWDQNTLNTSWEKAVCRVHCFRSFRDLTCFLYSTLDGLRKEISAPTKYPQAVCSKTIDRRTILYSWFNFVQNVL